ncbi:hypothetical protein ESCOMA231M_24220 [Escherichia coli]|nr:Uncharacterised protein [Escherichia coli]CAD5752699.1 Uncharacterised protein [Escherichia coli]
MRKNRFTVHQGIAVIRGYRVAQGNLPHKR